MTDFVTRAGLALVRFVMITREYPGRQHEIVMNREILVPFEFRQAADRVLGPARLGTDSY